MCVYIYIYESHTYTLAPTSSKGRCWNPNRMGHHVYLCGVQTTYIHFSKYPFCNKNPTPEKSQLRSTTLWFWGFWGSLDPHLVGTRIIPGDPNRSPIMTGEIEKSQSCRFGPESSRQTLVPQLFRALPSVAASFWKFIGNKICNFVKLYIQGIFFSQGTFEDCVFLFPWWHILVGHPIWVFPEMVVPPISHPKRIIFSRKIHGFVGESRHFKETPK